MTILVAHKAHSLREWVSRRCKGVTRAFEHTNLMEEYLSLLDDLKQQTESESTALVLLQEIARDRRTQIIKSNNEVVLEATPKQLAYLEKLDVEHDAGISKSEASELIDKALKKN